MSTVIGLGKFPTLSLYGNTESTLAARVIPNPNQVMRRNLPRHSTIAIDHPGYKYRVLVPFTINSPQVSYKYVTSVTE